jgi:predicted N-acyltransferase
VTIVRQNPKASQYRLSTHESLREIGEAAYATLVNEGTPPFLRFAWLDALETSGCIAEGRGWAPLHLSLHRGGELVAVAPAYVKGNSEGEFVFDHAWARFAQTQLGIGYYPKLIVAVPFTPATGPRVLCAPGAPRDEVLAAFAAGVKQLTEKLELSGAHVLFPAGPEAAELSGHEMLLRLGLQFHWRNPGYAGFDDFLSRFSSKRRNQIRRERRATAEQNIEIRTYTGRDIGEEQVDLAYEFYGSTVDKFSWGRRYLNRQFFHEVARRMPEALHIVLAFDRGSKRPLGGAFNLLGKEALYGRYWGAREERPFLHFNVCFYHSIEECIARGIPLFEPGAGGEHKVARGFEPSLTHSVHHLVDPRLRLAIADFLRRERRAHLEHIEQCKAEPVLKPA